MRFKKNKKIKQKITWGAISAGILGAVSLAGWLLKYKNQASKKGFLHHKDHGFHRQKIRRKTYSWKRFIREHKWFHGLFASFFIFSIWSAPFLEDYGYFFRSSLINLEPTPFTGTVSPVKKVPNWTTLSQAERRSHYDQIPRSKLIDLPDYDLRAMKEGIEWGSNNEAQRNTYLTYPVPNLGNYKLDATENSGSHTGVDIKLPIGTPIHAIANATVYRVKNSPTGFGKHVVLTHVGIPDLQNPSRKITIYSGYAHLSQILVREGELIQKNQIIGKSGNTGMATAPHLHFQIDRASAPFHPYWPFTWDDVKATGIGSYFEAVKKGVGKSRGRQHTIHPMNYVAAFDQYISPQLVASTIIPTSTIELAEKAPDIVPEREETVKIVKDIPVRKKITPPQKIANTKDLMVTFQTDRKFVPGQETIVRIRISDQKALGSSVINIESTLRHRAEVYPKTVKAADFKNNVAEIRVRTESESTFKIIAKGSFGEIKSPSLRAQVFSDVATSHKYASAIAYLRRNDIVTGYQDGSFKPEGVLNRAEAIKILLEGNDIVLKSASTTFQDVPTDAWFAPYIETAFQKNIIKGYGDGSFKPGNTITRAEFLKIAIAISGGELPEVTRAPYPDVAKDAWFAPYLSFAKTQDLIEAKRGGFVTPHQPITRAEAAQAMYQLSELRFMAKSD